VLDLYAPETHLNLTALCKPDKLTELELNEAECGSGYIPVFLAQMELLQKITFKNCEQMSFDVWRRIFRQCRSIEAVSVSADEGYISNGGFVLAMCTECAESLLALRLNGSFLSVDINFLSRLMKRCTRLQHLELVAKHAHFSSSSQQRVVSNCHAVTDLVLRLGPLDDALLRCIAENCPLLQFLCGDISTCTDSENPSLVVSEDGVAALVQGCKHLTTMKLLSQRNGAVREETRRLWGALYPHVAFT
jgi:hypothetical protein